MHYKLNLLYKLLNFLFWIIGIYSLHSFFENILNEEISIVIFILFFGLYIFLYFISEEHTENFYRKNYVDKELFDKLFLKYSIYKKYQGTLSFDEKTEFEEKIEKLNLEDDYEFENKYYYK